MKIVEKVAAVDGARMPQRTPKDDDASAGSGAPAEVKDFEGASTVFQEPWNRFGDLFPLPVPADCGFPGPSFLLSSRRAQQRVVRRRRLLEKETGTVSALNHLAGFSDPSQWPVFPRNRCQRETLLRIKRAHSTRAPPAEQQSPQAALRQLLKQGAGYSSGPGALASYIRDRVSLPTGQGEPVQLDKLLPEGDRRTLEFFEEEMLLSPEERAGVLEKGLEGLCYMDPLLANDPKRYHAFVADLFRCNLLGFTTNPRVQVGAFFVTKKNNKQRLIVDARKTNRLFRTPPSTSMGSMECWGRMELSMDDDLFIAQEDVKDFFYRLGIQKGLGEFFSFPAIDPFRLQRELGFLPIEVQDLSNTSFAPIHPHMRVLPMGFSWAFHLAHQAHVEISQRTLPRTVVIRDREVLPCIGSKDGEVKKAMLIYADNNNHLGVNQQEVQEEYQSMLSSLASHGLDTHDLVEPVTLGESLGIRIDGLNGRTTPTTSRDWRLHRALQALHLRPAISGGELQKIVGHLTIRALLNRNLMGIMRHVYVFIEQNYERRVKLWKSVAEELWIFQQLMVLGINEMRAVWDPYVMCTDACLTGYAVMESVGPVTDVDHIGRLDERWRFKRARGNVLAPRFHALHHDAIFEDVDTVLPRVSGEVLGEVTIDEQFNEVRRCMMAPENWQLLWRSPIRFKEPVHLIEARSILGAVKHRARDASRHGMHHLVLNDNMSVVLAVSKGRCSNYNLLRLVRRISAHCLACGFHLHVRWIPSEYNTADKDSRFWEPFPNGHGTEGKTKERGPCVYKGGSEERKREAEDPRRGGVPYQEEERLKLGNQGRSQPGPSSLSAAARVVEGAQEEERAGLGKAQEIFKEDESNSRREGPAGDGQHQRTPEERLCTEARDVLFLRSEIPGEDRDRGRIRRSALRVRGSSVLRRRGFEFRSEVAGRPRVRETRVCKRRQTVGPKIQESLEGLEETEPNPNEVAYAGVPEVHDQRHLSEVWTSRGSTLQRGNFFHLCKTGRDAASHGSRCCGQQPGVSSRCRSFRTPRAGREFKGGHLRRDFGFGRCKSTLAGPSHGGIGSGQAEKGGARCKPLELQRQELSSEVAKGGGASSGRTNGCKPIPEPTWGSQPRPPEKAEVDTGYPEKGKMGIGQQCPNIRQTRKASASSQPVWGEVPAAWRGVAEELRHILPEWCAAASNQPSAATRPNLQRQIFLSLFGGKGEGARFVSSQGGLGIIVDFEFSSANDLSKPSRWKDVRVLAWHSTLVGIDLPCNTWSRARRAPWWSKMPSALRDDDQYIFGLPHLSKSDSAKVQGANLMLRESVRLIKFCLRYGIPGYLENPWTSRVWKTPAIRRLLRSQHVFLVRADMCQYHTQWRKPTGLLIWGCYPFTFKTCWHGHLCKRTHKPHLQLSGISGGKFLTHQAQIYTKQFAEALLTGLTHHSYPPH